MRDEGIGASDRLFPARTQGSVTVKFRTKDSIVRIGREIDIE
jgi:hypothetical protein